MSEDNQTLLAVALVCVVLICFVARQNKKIGIINAVVFILYTARMLYGLEYQSQYGAGLVWFVYLIFLMLLHIVISATYLIVKIVQKRRNK